MSEKLRPREWIVISILLIFFVVALFWTRSQSVVFFRQFPTRMASFKIWPDARALYEKALIERVNIHIPDFAKLAQALNTAETRSDVWESCVTYHRDIIEAMPGRYEAWLVKGVCEYYRGDLPQAEQSLIVTASQKQDLFWVHYDLGMLYYNHGAYKQAARELRQAIERGRVYNGRDWLGSKVVADIVRADQTRDLARSFSQAYRDTYKALAASCLLINDQSCALDSAQTGRRLSRGDEDFLVMHGAILLRYGLVEEATKSLKEAILRNPSSGAAYFFLAVASKQSKDESGFIMLVKKSQELGFDPDHFLSKLKFPLRIY